MTVMRTLYLLFSLVNLFLVQGHIIGQQCDWTGSGLSGEEKRGVRPVYLRCSEGRLKWSYPEGALRVLLRLGSSGREFRACLRPAPELPLTASVYLEGPRSLNKLYAPGEASPRPHVRCVQSRGGQVALYVEGSGEHPIHRNLVDISYDLEPIAKGSIYDPLEECRPCTKEEMVHAYCSSELVTRGIIQRVEPIEDTDVSDIVVKVTKTLRRWTSWGLNDVEEEDLDKEVIQVGRHCGAQHGAGEMILMARRKLGQLVLRCAPRLQEWRDVIKEAQAKDSAHCVLTS
ncbi:hypothetical protein GE061_004151 [Apolygus lucorum]|uniref:Meteorin-like protein n=2 Tax=Mirini TaxID=236659 RepID=A0A8S9X111_APOLU|nr:hypothetical protein GE061_004151 [Apolygus lucorum]